MSKKLLAFISLLLVGFVAIFIYINASTTNNTSNIPANKSNESMVQPLSAPQKSEENTTMPIEKKTGEYISYNKSRFQDANTGKVVLFFYASWCPTCSSLNKDINENLGNIAPNVTIIKVAYDDITGGSEEELAYKKTYGITYQHTLVQIDENGTMLKKWVNSPTLTDLLSQII